MLGVRYPASNPVMCRDSAQIEPVSRAAASTTFSVRSPSTGASR